MERKDLVLTYLKHLDIQYQLYEHPPLSHIEEAMAYWTQPNASHCKNLFFRNHKGNKHYLVSFDWNQMMDIKQLEEKLKEGKLSFASEKRMEKYLGLLPGSVSPFGLINDKEKEVKFYMDKNLLSKDYFSFHPNDNRFSLVISKQDFLKYLASWGGDYEFLDLY